MFAGFAPKRVLERSAEAVRMNAPRCGETSLCFLPRCDTPRPSTQSPAHRSSSHPVARPQPRCALVTADTSRVPLRQARRPRVWAETLRCERRAHAIPFQQSVSADVPASSGSLAHRARGRRVRPTASRPADRIAPPNLREGPVGSASFPLKEGLVHRLSRGLPRSRPMSSWTRLRAAPPSPAAPRVVAAVCALPRELLTSLCVCRGTSRPTPPRSAPRATRALPSPPEGGSASPASSHAHLRVFARLRWVPTPSLPRRPSAALPVGQARSHPG